MAVVISPILNRVGLILTTNHLTDGLYIPPESRRFFVSWNEHSRKTDHPDSFWKEYYKWLESGGYGHVAAYLHDLDLSDFDPKAPPPLTEAFWTIVQSNRAPEDAELADALDRLCNDEFDCGPVNAFTLDELKDAATGEFATQINKTPVRVLNHRLGKIGYAPVLNPDAKDGFWQIGARRRVIYARAGDRNSRLMWAQAKVTELNRPAAKVRPTPEFDEFAI